METESQTKAIAQFIEYLYRALEECYEKQKTETKWWWQLLSRDRKSQKGSEAATFVLALKNKLMLT
jgi:hypothetical protein